MLRLARRRWRRPFGEGIHPKWWDGAGPIAERDDLGKFSGLPIVEPSNDHWNRTGGEDPVDMPPPVAPHVTYRPPGRIALSDRDQVPSRSIHDDVCAAPKWARIEAATSSVHGLW